MSEPLPPPTPVPDGTPERAPLLRRNVPKRFTVSTLLAVAVFAALVISYTLALPSGFGVVAPGPVVRLTGAPTGTAVVDDGSGDRGWFAFTTVNVDELTYFEALSARMRGHTVIKLGAAVKDSPALAQMASSKEVAAALALLTTGAPAPAPDGVLVLDVADGSPAQRSGIEAGDVLLSANGTPVVLPAELRAAITGASSVRLALRRGSEEISVRAVPEGGRIGVEVAPSYAGSLAGLMDVDTAAVGGPSAGLMLTLAYIDALSPGDLTAGLQVAGTGSIDPLGLVGEIAGLPYKVRAASDAGAEVFFVPAGQAYLTADPVPGMEFVSVESFVDALRYLCDAGATDEVCAEVRQ